MPDKTASLIDLDFICFPLGELETSIPWVSAVSNARRQPTGHCRYVEFSQWVAKIVEGDSGSAIA